MYVTPAEVAAELGLSSTDDRVQRACDTADEVIDGYCDRFDPMPSPTPDSVRQAAVELAVDLLRRPAAPYGYFVTDVTIASVGPDVARRVKSLLRPFKQSWGVA